MPEKLGHVYIVSDEEMMEIEDSDEDASEVSDMNKCDDSSSSENEFEFDGDDNA